jgi:NarL family two-component system response regulator LiaR
MSVPAKIRIMLVDDYFIVRSGLKAFLLVQKDFELVAEASDGVEAVQLCERLQPDVILMDLLMPNMDGATATRIICEKYPNIHILILTSFKEDNLIHDALKAGAIGYLLKNISATELSNAIRMVHQGQPILSPEATRVLVQDTAQRDMMVLGSDLTERERNILGLIAKGQDNQQIAEAVFLSQSTVKFHVSNILSKLQVSSRTEAAVFALQNNLVPKQG